MTDNVNSPSHYKLNPHGIECIDAIQASLATETNGYHGALKANVIKYIWRFKDKGKPLEDLRKAQWYLQRLIDDITKEIETAKRALEQPAEEQPSAPYLPPAPTDKQDILKEWLELQRSERETRKPPVYTPGFGRVSVRRT